MKKIFTKIAILLFALFFTFSYDVISQLYNSTTIQTPNGSDVEAGIFVPTVGFPEYSSKEKREIASYWMKKYQLLILVEDATFTYNCHSYAWRVSEGGSACWINAALKNDYNNFISIPGYLINSNLTAPSHNNIKNYWEDLSWIECPEIEAEKVFFGSTWKWEYYEYAQGQWRYQWVYESDHSAEYIDPWNLPWFFKSKWGKGPLFIHRKEDCPYDISDLRYYKKGPTISGPSSVCFVGAEFDLACKGFFYCPPGVIINWSVTGPFSITTQNNHRTTVKQTALGTSFVTGVLTAKIGSKVIDSKVISACSPKIIGNFTGVCCSGNLFTIENVPSSITTANWILSGPFSFSSSSMQTTSSVYPVTVFWTGTSSSSGSLSAIVGGYATPAISLSPCAPSSIFFSEPTVNTTKTVKSCSNITVQNVTVNYPATLTIEASGNITIQNVTVTSGAKLILQTSGDVVINELDVQPGAVYEKR